ncbi:MAG TPA: EpsI family protein [Pyrinomonadaceae bacterium]|nr:EpsI family protein [Pyrinomonadaceae bacterium]
MKASWRFTTLFVLLVAGGVVVNAWDSLGEAHVNRKELKDFPRQVGAWEQVGGDLRFDNQTLSVLKASDYLMRDFRSPSGQRGNFYVGYYASQREGATYHSPLNCLPGSGWVMSNPDRITVTPSGRASFVANKYVIENGGKREIMIYWYQGRGRVVASEYWGKIYTVLDSVKLRRSDGAMVRVMVPVGGSEANALDAAVELAANVSTALPEYVPD